MIKKGFTDAIPVMLGYFPIAITFGILAKTSGVDVFNGVFMSIFIYAGASQFMAVSMINSQIGLLSIIFATFLMNFRHLVMSASMKMKLTKIDKKYYPIIGFLLTDETFSVLSMKKDLKSYKYLLSFQVFCYFSWILGTLTGYLTGMFIPVIIVSSLGIALYALFIALIIPSWKKHNKAIVLSVSAGILNLLIQKFNLLNPSFSFIVSVILISIIGAVFINDKKSKKF
ncbi:MAG: AzlC family ABC transporter permease [Bacillota bacterium]|nr:AzlC family ABC transporter permease [Bacillota bacterium]